MLVGGCREVLWEDKDLRRGRLRLSPERPAISLRGSKNPLAVYSIIEPPGQCFDCCCNSPACKQPREHVGDPLPENLATESEHDLVRGLGRSVEGVASGRGSVAGDRACPTAPSPPPGAGEDRQQGAPQSKPFGTGLCAGYRWRLRRRQAASPTSPAGFLQRILSGAPSCASVSRQP